MLFIPLSILLFQARTVVLVCLLCRTLEFIFFFQAEDGIRDDLVTGVQTCALPIFPETRQKCAAAMEKYGENHWWEPDVDPRKFAYYQLHEDLMLCAKFSQLHSAVELLLGRPVYTHEFGISIDALRQEAERAWTYGVGCTSDAERQERVTESINHLATWSLAHGKQFIGVQLPESETQQ